MASTADDDGAPPSKRARSEVSVSIDAMAATQAQLKCSTDPHLQAKLLLDYSAQAIAPDANTEEAIDFLFAFLQRSQTPSSEVAKGGDTKNPPSVDCSGGGGSSGSNAVVVAAIVRGLRGLLAVNPSVVEPMIQLDAMGEQLTQCISVPEDFKLRRDMLRIVLDCLVPARKFTQTEQLLQVCMEDHDDGLRAICLDGYIRLVDAGHRMQCAQLQELVGRLCRLLAVSDDARTRQLAARALGRVVALDEATMSLVQPPILHALACNVRDASPRVRREIAVAFREFVAAGSLPESLFLHLLQKTQIDEDLSEIDTQSVAMLSNGAMLTLMEDDDEEVVTETSTSIRVLCESGAWSSDLIDRAVASHIELVSLVAGGHEGNLLVVLANLHVLLTISKEKEGDKYPLTREELFYVLGSLPTTSLDVARSVLMIIPLVAIEHAHAAARVVKFIIQCSRIQPLAGSIQTTRTFTHAVRDATQLLADTWSHDGVTLATECLAELRGVARTQQRAVVNPLAECCSVLHDVLCSPTDRLAVRHSVKEPLGNRRPTFLGEGATADRPSSGVNSYPGRALASALIRQISDTLVTLQRMVARDGASSLSSSERVIRKCSELQTLCRSLFVRTQFHVDKNTKAILLQLLFVSTWGCAKPTAFKTLLQDALAFAHDVPVFRETLDHLQANATDSQGNKEHFRRLVAAMSVDKLTQQLRMGRFDTIARALTVDPDPVAAAETHEVSSHVPFTLRVRCVLHNVVSSTSELVVQARLPSGDVTWAPLHITAATGKGSGGEDQHDTSHAEATLSLQFKPFSDPSHVTLTVCVKTPHVFTTQSQVNVVVDEYIALSAVTKLQVLHRFNTAVRHQSSRSG